MNTKINKLHIVLASQNSKLGGVAATYRPVDITCPLDCQLLNNGCYSQRGHANIQQLIANKYKDEFEKLAEVKLVRHHVSGDVFLDDELDVNYICELLGFHYRHPEVVGWGYTHRHEDWDDAGFSPNIHPGNLTILASVDTLSEAEYAWRCGWKTARVINSLSERHPSEIFCPIDKAKFFKRKVKQLTCASCKLCWTTSRNIAFLRT